MFRAGVVELAMEVLGWVNIGCGIEDFLASF